MKQLKEIERSENKENKKWEVDRVRKNRQIKIMKLQKKGNRRVKMFEYSRQILKVKKRDKQTSEIENKK